MTTVTPTPTPVPLTVDELTAYSLPAAVAAPLADYLAALNASDVATVAADNARRAAKGEDPLPWTRYAVIDIDRAAPRSGRWLRVVQLDRSGHGASVLAFVERATGDVYKPDGWKRPAKGVRFRLADDTSRARLMASAAAVGATHGGHLYR